MVKHHINIIGCPVKSLTAFTMQTRILGYDSAAVAVAFRTAGVNGPYGCAFPPMASLRSQSGKLREKSFLQEERRTKKKDDDVY